jgi:mutator protein MutT
MIPVLVPVAVSVFYRRCSDGTFQTWIQQRTDGPLKGLWEFPGGKIEPGETSWQALVREIKEETNVDIRSQGQLLGVFPHDYGDKRVLLYVFMVEWEESLGQAQGMTVPITPQTTGREWAFPLLEANYGLVEHVRRALYDGRT